MCYTFFSINLLLKKEKKELIYIVILIVILIIIPKHNKAEKEAGHLFIDMYDIPVKKTKNPIRQMTLLEKHFGVQGFKSYQYKTAGFLLGGILAGFLSFFIGLMLSAGGNGAMTILSLLFFFGGFVLFVGGAVYSYVRMYQVHSRIRPQTWAKFFGKVDPELDTSFLQQKNWQKALLVELVENKK